MMRLFFLLLCILLNFSKSSAQNEKYIFEIHTREEFNQFSGEPLSHAFAGVSSVKLVYNLDDKNLYFINSKKYQLHFTFCKDIFGDDNLPDFNHQNYRENQGRKYILATLNYFRDAQIYTLEFSPADDINQESVEFLYNQIQSHFFSPNQLFLQLSTHSLMTHAKWNIPIISVSDLFAGLKLQIIQKGETNGKLLIVNADSLNYLGDIRNNVLLICGNSNDIPLCKGIITTNFQTPLSHISILSQNRKTPLVALKEASTLKTITELQNQDVIFKVMQDTFLLLSDSLYGNADKVKVMKVIRLKIDTIHKAVTPLKKIRMKDTGIFGVKAVNLAQLHRVKYKGNLITIPEGAFAVPMFYYWQHLKNSGTDSNINQLLANFSDMPKTNIQKQLDIIRKSILKATINPELITEVENRIKSTGTVMRFRFRSSSNAEDLEGFNGAGLYTSETGIVGEKSKSVEKAIKKVWASLWNERAFEERCNAGIDQKTIGMAILAHRSFPEEYANGVAITRNLYRDFDFGFVINTQLGDNSLVKPKSNETCEQVISYFNSSDPFFNEKEAVEYLSFSSLNKGQPLLDRKEIFELTQQLDKIKRRFYRKLKAWKKVSYKDFAMDVEFKAEIQNNRKVFYFKQARPFN